MADLTKGIVFLEVSKSLDPKHQNVNKINARRFNSSYSKSIIFEDSSGLQFSYTIEKSFSIKNITDFLACKFRNVKIV